MPDITEIAIILPADGRIPHDERLTVRQRHGQRVIIADVATPDEESLSAEMAGQVTFARQRSEVPDEQWNSLSDPERLALDGFWLRQSEEYRQAEANRPGQGAAWDHPDFTPPDPPEGTDLSGWPVAGLNDRLRGTAALGLIMVNGPGDLAFKPDQAAKVMAKTQQGLNWLSRQHQLAPPVFVVDTSIISISTPADPTAPDLEAVWRDPVMASLGYTGGYAAVTKYAQALKSRHRTDSGYVSFFCHYPLHHYAYARASVPETVMEYKNGRWGPDNIDRIFAHETGHIFGAPDEYPNSNCNCSSRYGYYHVENLNCSLCGPGVKCIMLNNDFTMCQWTPRHLGAPQWNIPGTVTADTPVAVGNVVYYRELFSNALWRVNTDGTRREHLPGNFTLSAVTVDRGVIYYRGRNDRIYRVNTDGTGLGPVGANWTISWVTIADGVIYYRGRDNRIYRVNTDGSGFSTVGANWTTSGVTVADGVIYYRGCDNRIYRVNTDGSGFSTVGANWTITVPSVADGVIYYRGRNNQIYRVNTDGSGFGLLTNHVALSALAVADGVIYYRGVVDGLFRINIDGTGNGLLGPNQTLATPFISDKAVYFRGTNNGLYMINLT
jgi:Domain of unknown function (DUF5050)